MAKKFKKIKRPKMGLGGDLQKAGVGQGIGAVAGKFYPGIGNILGSMVDLNLSQLDKLEEAITAPVGKPMYRNTGISYASGGTTRENIPVEVEGGEVIDDGVQVEEVVGADHEEGGVDMDLPEGTDVYSKRVKHPKTGETMAERKKKREIAEQKAAEYLSKRQGDFYAKQTYKRVREANAIQDAEDMAIQEYFKTVEMAKQKRASEEQEQAEMMQQFDEDSMEQAEGIQEQAPQEEVQELALGVDGLEEEIKKKPTTPYDPTHPNWTQNRDAWWNSEDSKGYSKIDKKGIANPDYGYSQWLKKRISVATPEDIQKEAEAMIKHANTNVVEKPLNTNASFLSTNLEQNIPTDAMPGKGINDFSENDQGGYGDEFRSELTEDSESFEDSTIDKKRNSYKRIEGDKLGYAGQSLKGIAPLLTTLTNNLNTEAPKNTGKNFGAEALQEIRGMEGLAGTEYQQALQQVNESANSFNNSLRNSASSINTLRAMRGMTEKTKEKMVTQAVSRYAQAKNQIAQMKARTLLMKNQMEVQGENRRFDIAEQQKDNFYTNLNEDLTNLGDSIVSKGKNLNQEEDNSNKLNLINSIYGDGETSIDQFGNILYGDENLPLKTKKKNTKKKKRKFNKTSKKSNRISRIDKEFEDSFEDED